MNLANFDAASVDWQPLPGPDGNPADHIEMSIMNVDDEAKIVDVLFKFAANEKILLPIIKSQEWYLFLCSNESSILFRDLSLKQ